MKRILSGVAILALTFFAPVARAGTSTNQAPAVVRAGTSTNQPPAVDKPWTTKQAKVEKEPNPPNQNALRKLGRGFANLLFGVVEVPNQYFKVTAENGGGAGWTYGVPRGILCWLGRELVGVYEIVTFPIPAPRGYQPVIKPEWPNEDYDPS